MISHKKDKVPSSKTVIRLSIVHALKLNILRNKCGSYVSRTIGVAQRVSHKAFHKRCRLFSFIAYILYHIDPNKIVQFCLNSTGLILETFKQ